MNQIETYAVNLVGRGAEYIAEDGVFENEDDWRAAAGLGVNMAIAIRENPEAFHAWYLSTTGVEAES